MVVYRPFYTRHYNAFKSLSNHLVNNKMSSLKSILCILFWHNIIHLPNAIVFIGSPLACWEGEFRFADSAMRNKVRSFLTLFRANYKCKKIAPDIRRYMLY